MKLTVAAFVFAYVVVSTLITGGFRTTSTAPGSSSTRIQQEPEAKSISPQEGSAATEDPDKELFVGWDKPDLAILISGRQNGYIEPCGCTGLQNQKGGMLRREVLYRELTEDKNWQVIGIDTGNQIHRTWPQAQLKLATTCAEC